MSSLPKIEGATLLSVEEALLFLSVDDREYKGYWWLRTPGERHDLATIVYDNGGVNFFGNTVDYYHNYLRPALRINIENSDFEIGDVFVFGKKWFKIISNDLAFCTGDIGEFCFRKNFKADDANDYEKSDAKKIVHQWFVRATNYHEMLDRQMSEYQEDKKTSC